MEFVCLGCGQKCRVTQKQKSQRARCKCGQITIVPPTPPPPAASAVTIPAPPISAPKVEHVRTQDNARRRKLNVFPWFLTFIWGGWLISVPYIFYSTAWDYKFAYGDRIFLENGQNFDAVAWGAGAMATAVTFAVVTGVPLFIASVVGYFFIRKPV